jgi:hypothetical protein
VVLGEILEHCIEPTAIMRECLRPLKSGGLVVVTTPNSRYVGLHDCPYHPDRQPGTDTARLQFLPDTHISVFTLARLRALLKSCGLQITECAYEGSVAYSDRFSPLKPLMSPRQLDMLSRTINRVPLLGGLLSYTLFAVGRKTG